jgi:MFS family permease
MVQKIYSMCRGKSIAAARRYPDHGGFADEVETMFGALRGGGALTVTLAAAGVLMVTMGIRQSFGLFVSPVNSSTGMGVATISLALAVAQFAWGAIQPVAGAVADRYGSRPVIRAGLVVLALGCALTPLATGPLGLVMTIGLLTAIGSGASSFSVLIGAAAQRLPADARGVASGVINAGGSFGQFVFAPVVQKVIQAAGWMNAMWALGAAALLALPLVGRVAGGEGGEGAHHRQVVSGDSGLRQAVARAVADRSYLLLNAGFFTCGFHIAFLVTHLPGEVDLCGLPPTVASASLAIIGLANIFGSLFAGACVSRYRSKHVLAVMYGSRALLIACYLMAPRDTWTYYLFAAGLGFTWLATVPPTAAIVGKLFGMRYLATLFGLTLLSHQVGGFFGAWLGGLAVTRFGNYEWMWYADMALAALAALVNLPIRESLVSRPAAAAA